MKIYLHANGFNTLKMILISDGIYVSIHSSLFVEVFFVCFLHKENIIKLGIKLCNDIGKTSAECCAFIMRILFSNP